MTLIPSLEVAGATALLRTESGTLELRTPAEAKKLGDLCREAEDRLAQHQREAADRAAAWDINRRNAARDAEPFGTVSTAVTVHLTPVFGCPECDLPDGAA